MTEKLRNRKRISVNVAIFSWNHRQFLVTKQISYLVTSIAIQLRDRQAGRHMIFANPWESISSLGASPLGMKWLPRVCKNHSLPLGDHAILYFKTEVKSNYSLYFQYQLQKYWNLMFTFGSTFQFVIRNGILVKALKAGVQVEKPEILQWLIDVLQC